MSLLFNATISTQRGVGSVDGQGITVAPAAAEGLDTDVPCSIQNKGGGYNGGEFEGRSQIDSYVIYTDSPLNAAIDDIAIDDQGRTFVLQAVNIDLAGRGLKFRHKARLMTTRTDLATAGG